MKFKMIVLVLFSLLTVPSAHAIGFGSQSEYQRRIEGRERRNEAIAEARYKVSQAAREVRISSALDRKLGLPAGSMRSTSSANRLGVSFASSDRRIICEDEQSYGIYTISCVDQQGEYVGQLTSKEIEALD